MKPHMISLLLSYVCVASISATLITPALPAIADFYAVGTNNLSWVVAIFLCGYVVGQLIYAPLAKRYGSLNALRGGLMLNIIGIMICLSSLSIVSFPILLLGRLLTALGAASGLACTFMLMHDLLNEAEYKHAMSFTVLAFTLGIGLAVFLGGLITEYFHWQMCFWILLIHGITMLILTSCFTKYQKIKSIELIQCRIIIRNYWHALCNLKLIKFSCAIGLVSAFSYVYAAIAPLYANFDLHMNPAAYGIWNGLNMIGMLCGGLIGGKIMKKHGAKKALHWGLIGFLPCCISLAIIAICNLKFAIVFFATTALMYYFGGFLFPSGSYFAMDSVKDKANGSSMMSFINMLTATLSVMIVGYLPLKPIAAFSVIITVIYISIAWMAWKTKFK